MYFKLKGYEIAFESVIKEADAHFQEMDTFWQDLSPTWSLLESIRQNIQKYAELYVKMIWSPSYNECTCDMYHHFNPAM